ncbi:hypothetical protein [Hymenobacter wooponensis]|uniref:Lipocalin-like domain-containing protein n=1 Tax=Hymenobacter wooponensis TaxID=1525360 RepID=A0A4Z0ME72_9BACT|nr:hypothetical protein [Hymenobacter wooponensis]TGD77660.1 hypothetical protein EU557_23090 [Hymenobacter wooponensis]
MRLVFVLLMVGSLMSCQKDSTAASAAALLPGDWYQQSVTFYHYDLEGRLRSEQTSPSGPHNKLMVTDSTIAYYSDISSGPGPGPTPGQWVVRRYSLQGDTIRYVNDGRPEVIKEISAHRLVLHHPGRAAITPGFSTGYSEHDATYTR